MENYLYPISQDIAEALDEAGIFYFHHIRNNQDHILLPFAIKGGPMAMMSAISDADTPGTAIRLWGLLNAPEDKFDSVSRTCIQLNNILRYFKFTVDEDGDVNMEYDLPLCTPREAVGSMVAELFYRAHSILDDYFKHLGKAVFADKTDETIRFDFGSIQEMLRSHRADDPDDYVDVDEDEND